MPGEKKPADSQAKNQESKKEDKDFKRPTFNLRYNTPLHLAVHHASDEIVKILLDKGADVNIKNEAYLTPLHVAIKKGHENTVKILLAHGADVNAENYDNRTSLYLAAELGHTNIVQDLLKYKPELNDKNRLSLICAVCGDKKSKEIVDALLKYGYCVESEDIRNSDFLHSSVVHGHIEIVSDLIRFKVDVNQYDKGFTILHNAIKHGHDEMVSLIVHNDADVNLKDRRGRTALWHAIEKENVLIVRLLMANKANVNDKCNPLHIAVRKGNKKVMKILLSAKANPNVFDEDGNTALHIALSYQNDDTEEIGTLLISNGAKVNIKAFDGKTPLHLAAANGHKNIVKLLLESGADVEGNR